MTGPEDQRLVADLVDISERGFGAITEGLHTLKEELRTLRHELIGPATNREHVHISVVKMLVGGLLLLNVLVVVWFTGLAPRISHDGVELREYRASPAQNH